MSTVLKVSLVLLCGWIFMGTVKQIGTDFANLRANNLDRVELAIDSCR